MLVNLICKVMSIYNKLEIPNFAAKSIEWSNSVLSLYGNSGLGRFAVKSPIRFPKPAASIKHLTPASCPPLSSANTALQWEGLLLENFSGNRKLGLGYRSKYPLSLARLINLSVISLIAVCVKVSFIVHKSNSIGDRFFIGCNVLSCVDIMNPDGLNF